MTAAGRHPAVTLRHAREDDADRVMEWRNDGDAVRFSVTGRPVSEVEHRKWFRALLADRRVRLWIAVDAGKAVGQVRLDVTEGTGTVSIAVAKEHRGRGIAVSMLLTLIEAVAGEDDLRRLKALTHPDNAASLRTFERAGFRRVGAPEGGFLVLLRQLPEGARPGDAP
ncbi:MAG: GNAT family N-acetyltransferase [Candidatus Dormibacter sp.]